MVCDLDAAGSALDVTVPEVASLRDLADTANLEALANLNDAAAAAGDLAGVGWAKPVDDVTLHAPYRPRQNVIRAGGNHASGTTPAPTSKGKVWLRYYSKSPSAVNDPGAPISWPRRLTGNVYAEPQLAVIIGKDASFVEEADVRDHVFGYALCTDVSSADLKHKHGQWPKAVSLDTFFPWGPWLVTRDEIADPDDLAVSLWLNDKLVIEANTSDSQLSADEIVSQISFGMRLSPGDVLLTGTPDVPGFGMEPERWLVDGDELRSEIEPIGTLTNRVETV
jgi:2-keto-4-pentenoate hydratase/2-oxohepta-3-ene-1,7-dioic acid hydratase in catechol pathway